ncbi:hypothetical protein [Paenarthrobacter sp. PH39-S1]|nr:hypothetical protein [Paenarthrobacter sp. PH39-S1]MDJ0355346.1 hypothetical protein [Paenarthrobacter sp. PH39-S1]
MDSPFPRCLERDRQLLEGIDRADREVLGALLRWISANAEVGSRW